MKKERKLSNIIKQADTLFSLHIRNKYAKDGLVQCFTCDRRFPIKDMDAGHFVSRTFKVLRWSELNVFPQCIFCNRFREGMKDEFAVRLERKFPGRLEELNKWKYMPPTTLKRLELLELIKELKEKLQETGV